MRTTTHSIGSISYPDEICFAFNPTYIKVTGCSHEELLITATVGGSSYSQRAMVYSGTCVVNLARTLQLFFETADVVSTRSVVVTVHVTAGASDFGFTTTAIWGNIKPGETFNGARTVRWFNNFPMTVSVFTGTTFTELTPSGEGVLINSTPWDYTFDYTFGTRASEAVTVVADDRQDGMFLRWVDRHGRLQFFLFTMGVKEIRNEESGQELTQNYVDLNGNSFRSIKRQQAFFSRNTQHLSATCVDEEEYTMLESILTSPVIDLYHRDTVVGWEPVVIATSTVKRDRQTLQDFEFSIMLPNTNAQVL